MAAITSIISFVAWGSRLSLSLYKFGASIPSATRDVSRIAKSVSLLSLTLKQVGATLREDDSVPSPEAFETVQQILYQCQNVFGEIEALVPVNELQEDTKNDSVSSEAIRIWKWTLASKTRMDYLLGHLESVKLTLSVMLQTFYTVKIIRWTRTHPTISPTKMADTIQNEKMQMEILIIEQQMSLISASKLYDELRRSEAFSNPRLLQNNEASNSLMVLGEYVERSVAPTSLVPFQETSLAQLDASAHNIEGLTQVLQVSSAYIDQLLARWTRLQEIQERMDQLQHEAEEQTRQQQQDRRRSQQATVESDDSDDQLGALPGVKRAGRNFAAPVPQRPGSIQPLFPGPPTLPMPVSDPKLSSKVPISPPSSQCGVSPRSSGILARSPSLHSQSPQSPRTSISSLPVRAAAAVTTKDEEESVDLGIPWRLCLKTYYWEYVDGRVDRSNTDLPISMAFTDRNAWTEIMASWVCREAIEEAGYRYTQIKKERSEEGRTKLETGFSISRPLNFAEVERLVERTVEMYRQRQRARSPKRSFSSSSAYPIQPRIPISADRTPRVIQPPALDRSSTAFPFPPPVQTYPPPLDRATTFPGQNPNYNPLPYSPVSPNTSNPTHTMSYTPQWAQNPPTPRSAHHKSSFSTNSPRTCTHAHLSYSNSNLSASTSSDSDIPIKQSNRRESSSSRRIPSSSRRKSRRSSAVGTLAKVGGLAALLDGIVDVASVF